jgi:hypothetical protein
MPMIAQKQREAGKGSEKQRLVVSRFVAQFLPIKREMRANRRREIATRLAS